MRIVMSDTLAKTFPLSTLLSYLGSCSNRFGVFRNLFRSNLEFLVPCQFTLEKSEVFRIPSTCKELHILAGTAWVTLAGRDIVLTAGEKVSLEPNKERAILSALGNKSVSLELLLTACSYILSEKDHESFSRNTKINFTSVYRR